MTGSVCVISGKKCGVNLKVYTKTYNLFQKKKKCNLCDCNLNGTCTSGCSQFAKNGTSCNSVADVNKFLFD